MARIPKFHIRVICQDDRSAQVLNKAREGTLGKIVKLSRIRKKIIFVTFRVEKIQFLLFEIHEKILTTFRG